MSTRFVIVNMIENLPKLNWNFCADTGGDLQKRGAETEQNRLFVATDAYGAAGVEGYDWHKTLSRRSYRRDIRPPYSQIFCICIWFCICIFVMYLYDWPKTSKHLWYLSRTPRTLSVEQIFSWSNLAPHEMFCMLCGGKLLYKRSNFLHMIYFACGVEQNWPT